MNDAAEKLEPVFPTSQGEFDRLSVMRDLGDAVDSIVRMLTTDAERGVFDDIEARTAQAMIDSAVRLRDLMERR